MPEKEHKTVKENDDPLQREDIQFTIICMIQSFFEQKEDNEKLKDYFKDLRGLIEATNVFINQEFDETVYEDYHPSDESDEEDKGNIRYPL